MVPYGIEPVRKPVTLIVVISLVVVFAIAFAVFYFNYASHNVAKQQANAIRTQITQPVALAAEDAVRQDVTNEVTVVQEAVATQPGGAINYGTIPTHTSVSGESLIVVPNGSGFSILGSYPASNFTYRYDSTTGAYS